MSGGKEDNVYENITRDSVHLQLGEEYASNRWVSWRYRTGGITTPVLVLLMVVLAISLLAVTLLHIRDQRKLQAVEEGVQKLSISLQPNKSSAVSAKELDILQLLDEAQAGVQMLNVQLRNASEAYRKMQDRLDRVPAAHAGALDPCRDVLTKITSGWKLFRGNLYYFSQEEKPWEEAERFCVSENSHLTSVTSEEEQEFVRKETSGQNHWIGLTDLGTEGTWRWVDGTEFREGSSTWGWEDLQPDNWHQFEGGREDCVEARFGRWNDANCTLSVKWICRKAFRLAGL